MAEMPAFAPVNEAPSEAVSSNQGLAGHPQMHQFCLISWRFDSIVLFASDAK